MQLTLPFAVPGHTKDDECPFCPGEEKRKDWKTYPGKENKSKVLRRVMNIPKTLVEAQEGVLPKDRNPSDGDNGRQVQDERRYVYTAKTSEEGPYIYKHDVFGEFSNEAHHAISGKQILSGHNIEKLILSTGNGGKLESDTGYSVNNCANGVCLPSYPKKYRGENAVRRWGGEGDDDSEEGTAPPLDDKMKRWAATLPMEAGKGQVHIGEHDHPGDLDDEDVAPIHHTSYPKQARDYLTDLFLVTVFRWSRECILCRKEDGGVKEPFPPPYRLNARLDAVSAKLIHHIHKVPPIGWVYFISKYARDYHYSRCQHPRSRH